MNQVAPFKLYIRPSLDGSLTQVRLYGSVATLPLPEFRQWIRQLASWSGTPIEFVLPVDCGSAAWFESWTDAVSDVPAHHLQIRFSIGRHRHQRGGRDAVR